MFSQPSHNLPIESYRRALVKRCIQHPAEELYDLNADPFGLHNLANDPKQAARLATMRAELTAWMKEQGDQETLFGEPLLLGKPGTLIDSGHKAEEAKIEGVK